MGEMGVLVQLIWPGMPLSSGFSEAFGRLIQGKIQPSAYLLVGIDHVARVVTVRVADGGSFRAIIEAAEVIRPEPDVRINGRSLVDLVADQFGEIMLILSRKEAMRLASESHRRAESAAGIDRTSSTA